MTVEEKLYLSLRACVGSSLSDFYWYAIMASAVWLFFYVVFPARFRHRRVSRRQPVKGQVRREFANSLRSILIFGLVTAAVVFMASSGWTRIYRTIDRYGWAWFFSSIVVMVLMHDTYFYWTHRLMHHRVLYRLFHRTHHCSTSPTPWAAYAFSPWEAFVQAGIGPLVVFTIPVHPAAFALFMGWQIAFNVFGHCGYEVWPRWFLRWGGGVIFNSVTHHAQHHEKFHANFGLYFNVWDRWMGTNHAEYQQQFQSATEGAVRH